MDRYEIAYTRVGRHGGGSGTPAPTPVTVEAHDHRGVERCVLADIRRRKLLGSRGIDVHVDLAAMRGAILAGVRDAGSFTITRTTEA